MCDCVYFTAHFINILYVNHMCVIVFILERIYVCDSVYFTAHSINMLYVNHMCVIVFILQRIP